MIVVSPEDRVALRKGGEDAVIKALVELSDGKRRRTLASQVISPAAYKAIVAGDPSKFLVSRAEEIVVAAKESLQ